MSGTGFQRGECSRPKRSLLLESMGLQRFRNSGKCHQISHFQQSTFPRTKSKIFVTRRLKCYLPTVGSPSETKMIRETDSGSSIPKLLASFKIKMARRRASLIFVPVKVTRCAVLLCTLSLHKNRPILGSDSSAWWLLMHRLFSTQILRMFSKWHKFPPGWSRFPSGVIFTL